MYNLYRKNRNRLPSGHITSILRRQKPTEPWLTRKNVINKAFINYRKQITGANVVIVPTKTSKNGTGKRVMDSEISELSNIKIFDEVLISNGMLEDLLEPLQIKKEENEKN